MAEMLLAFPDVVVAPDRSRYHAQACGVAHADGHWEGWIEFLPLDGGTPLRSPRETTQPNFTDVKYWATGLTRIYLEGALARAMAPPPPPLPESGAPLFDGPAPSRSRPLRASATETILDPFSVYEKGEELLRRELSAISSWHLVNILTGYDLTDIDAAALNRLPRGALVDLIVESVRNASVPR